jgi:hypothetical protein
LRHSAGAGDLNRQGAERERWIREHAARRKQSPLANGESSEIPQSSQSTNHLGDGTPEYARLLNRLIQKLKRLDMEAHSTELQTQRARFLNLDEL